MNLFDFTEKFIRCGEGEELMGANTEYTEYYLTDDGWIQGNSKFIGEPLRIADLPDEVKMHSYKHICVISEMRTVGSLNGGRSVEVISEKDGCEQKIKELLDKYPECQLF